MFHIVKNMELINAKIFDGEKIIEKGYVRFEGDANYYAFTLSDNQNIILVNAGDRVEFEYGEAEAGSRIVPAYLVTLR